MFDVKRLPRNGKMARRLLEFSKLNRINIDQSVHELATRDLVDQDVWNQWNLDVQERATAQFLVDWRCRGVVLDNGVRSRSIVLAATAADDVYPILIVGPTASLNEWRDQCLANFKTTEIGYLRNGSRVGEETAKIWICDLDTPVALMESVRARTVVLDQLIESAAKQSFYSFVNQEQRFSAMLQDAECLIVLQGLANMFINKVANLPAVFHEIRTTHSELRKVLDTYFWKGLRFQDVLDPPRNHDLKNYLTSRGYDVNNIIPLLHALGVSTHLLAEHNPGFAHIVDRSFLPIRALASDAPQMKQARREHEVEVAVGRSIADIMQGVVDGDPTMVRAMDQLFTNFWCSAKINALRGLCLEYVMNNQKTVVLANHNNLIRNIKLSFPIEDVRGVNSRAVTSRYLYPNGNWRAYTEMTAMSKLNFIVSDIGSLSEDILQNTDVLIMAEYPHAKEDFELICAACEAFNIKLFCITMANTWEEKLASLILSNESKTFQFIDDFRSKK